MRFLADANIESAIVLWLRAEGHDVVWANEFPPSVPDERLLELARNENRIVLTYDRDFGDLVFRERLVSSGVVLLRFQAPLQAQRLEMSQSYWPCIEETALGHFMVVSDRRVRVRPLPEVR